MLGALLTLAGLLVGRVGALRPSVWAQYRETPIPDGLDSTAETYAQTLELSDDTALVDRTPRMLERWVQRAAERRAAASADDAWHHLVHDLRRSWGTLLVDDASPFLIVEWGGWSDWQTFRGHYLNAPTPATQRREQQKVAWSWTKRIPTFVYNVYT